MSDFSDYCRRLEAYLCQKNGGHLIRIVGPAFEQVCGWAERGVPLAIAFRGVDRYCERYYSKAPRRRPVRIEFCEPDILELFDDWRRAVGVSAAAPVEEEARTARKPSLVSHIDRILLRLSTLAATSADALVPRGRLDGLMQELDGLSGQARNARGEARARIVERLASLDREMVAAAVREIDPATAASLRREADEELAPFGSRMAQDARARASEAAFERLVREKLKLPILTYE